MAEYDKSKHFSWGWCVGGMVLMFVIGFIADLVIAAAAVQAFGAILAIKAAGYLITGWVIGRMSEGQTIIEAGIAAVLSIAALLAIHGLLAAIATPEGGMLAGIPFALAMIGAFIGEKMQGDVITTKDD